MIAFGKAAVGLVILEIAYVTYASYHHAAEKSQHHVAVILAVVYAAGFVVYALARHRKPRSQPSGFRY